jgi:predicted Zn-dependent protease
MSQYARLLLIPLLVVCCSGPAAARQASPSASSQASAKAQSAAQAMSQGRFDDAARIYRDLLQSLPDEGGILMNLGMALAMGGHESDAVEPLERAVTLKPQLIPAQLFLGSSYLAVGRPADAIAPLKRAAAARATDLESRRMLAQAYMETGRPADAVVQLRAVTDLAPKAPAGWYALGHAYNALTQDAMETFNNEPEDSPWRQLLVADALLADGRLTDAFALQRSALDRLPAMVSIHDSLARIYDLSGHADWAAIERQKGILTPAACARRKALCEFRAGRYRASLAAALTGTDPESRYWRARAATELALAAFKRLDDLPDSRERRDVRGALALSQRRYTDAIAELKVALSFAPQDPALLDDLGTAYYSARDYDKAAETFMSLLAAHPDDPRLLTLAGDSLLQLQRVDEALPLLRRAVEHDQSDPMPRLALGRAYIQKGEFAAAVPLLEPQLPLDHDGSLHVQLARAYSGLNQKDKAEALLRKSQEIQQAAQAHGAAAGQRTIDPPK